ncbi:unnamed protein product [Psylliodes chrysocephalus]|uniref:Pentatricopeptide repeat-containing protein n=1 Tax=Psylliodes chrysocephalus TaxID=3402493 RepID=A0A9P0CMI8_9CUCU|nr:unnamed protein product [Psylliodes chrysocephala]
MLTTKLITTLKEVNCSAFRKIVQLNSHLRSAPNNLQNVRQLYAKSSLGLDGFEHTCQITQQQLENIADKFKEKMLENINNDSNKNMVFTEDLKNMIHVSTDEKDLELVVTMIKKFNSQNRELRFGSFIFGPVVMRLFYLHNRPDLAVECFKCPELNGFFDQIISYQLLLDLLFENQKYEEMLECVDLIKEKQLEGIRYPRNVVVLTMAACYKLNTKESLEYALKLWKELQEVGHFPMRRATTFCAGLAYNQGNPGIALEILTSAKNQNYTTVRNLKNIKMLTTKLITTLKEVNCSAFRKIVQLNSHLRSAPNNLQNVRQLYAKSSLGLDGFEHTCQITQQQLENIADKFKEKMLENINNDSNKNMVFTEDLKNMIHVSTDEKDLELVVTMIKKFNSQNRELRFGSFIFGPVVMRLFYLHNRPDLAVENTKESLEYALKLWKELQEVGHFPMRRATTFCAGLAYNQGNPGIALEILTSAKNQNYTTVRNLKVASLAALGSVENAIPILKGVFSEDMPGAQKHTFNKEVIDKVRDAIAALNHPELASEFEKIEKSLRNQGQIINTNMDEQLCQEIQAPVTYQNNRRNQDSRSTTSNKDTIKLENSYLQSISRLKMQALNSRQALADETELVK